MEILDKKVLNTSGGKGAKEISRLRQELLVFRRSTYIN